ncbi:hypothetical protein TNCV_4502311 [Trichonephila clavipes]|nr:hypothetical protein TNCV_4502311 [Trichonephila clavipes]
MLKVPGMPVCRTLVPPSVGNWKHQNYTATIGIPPIWFRSKKVISPPLEYSRNGMWCGLLGSDYAILNLNMSAEVSRYSRVQVKVDSIPREIRKRH